MSHDSRTPPPPAWLMWGMTFIERIGFPIAVCVYLMYMQVTIMPKVAKALTDVEKAVNNNTAMIRDMR